MTRKQLADGLRSLHEYVEIIDVRLIKRSGAIYIQFIPVPQGLATGLLVIADPNHKTPTKKREI